MVSICILIVIVVLVYHEIGRFDSECIVVGSVLIEFEGPSTTLSVTTVRIGGTEAKNVSI